MRYFLIGLAVLLFVIFGIVIFSRSTTQTGLPKASKLSTYANNDNSSVSYTVDGPINASENHRAVEITISPTSRTLQVFTGYQGQVMTNQVLGNDSTAYGQFLAALDRSGFTKTRRASVAGGQTAVCPLNSRNTYQINNGSDIVMRTWAAPCVSGTFGGNVSTVNTLFQTQIPNYTTLTQGVSVSGGGNVSVF